ncbi:TPA: hypothetical protein ACHIW3_002628 [Escherichia coli]
MILKDIYLYPDLTEFDDNITNKFRLESRSLCNFIGKKIKERHIVTKNYKRICVVGRQKEKSLYVNSSNVLVVNTLIDIAKYLSLEDSSISKNEYFINIIEQAIDEHIDDFLDISAIIKSSIFSFRELVYVNSWVLKDNKIKSLDIEYSLKCYLSIDSFSLYLTLTHKDVEFYREKIMSTIPDEVMFSNQIKNVIDKNGDILIMNNKGMEIYSMNRIKIRKIMLKNNIR